MDASEYYRRLLSSPSGNGNGGLESTNNRNALAGYKTFQISISEVMELTDLDFSGLLPFDGFSQHELAGNPRIRERIDNLSNVRI